jgi:MFS family permease
MKLSPLSFAIFLCYFLFSCCVSSTFIVIEQSLYEYGEDSNSLTIVETLKSLAYLGVALLLAPFLHSIGYKKLLLPTVAITSLLALFMPFGTNLFIPKLFYFFSGLGLGFSRLIGYKIIYTLTHNNRNHFTGIVNFFEGLFFLGILFSLVLFGGALQYDFVAWRKVFLVIGFLGIATTVFLYQINMKSLAIPHELQLNIFDTNDIKQVFKSSLAVFRYTLVWVVLLTLFLYVLNENQFYKWFPLFSTNILHLSKTLSPQILIPIVFSGFLGRLVASIILLNTNSLTVLLVCLFSVMVILFSITHLTQKEHFAAVDSWFLLPPVIWLLPLLSFFWSPVLPTLLVIVFTHTQTEKYHNKTAMLGLLMATLFFFQYLTKPITNYLFSIFSVSIAFFVSIIFVMLLFTLLILLVNDLKKNV